MRKETQPSLLNLESPTVVKRKRRKRRIRKSAVGNAAAAICPIEPGCEIFGFTKGQFSLTDIVLHILQYTGPADVVISTWTAAHADIQTHHRLLASGGVRSLRFIIDRGFPSRQPEYCDLLVSKFGPDAIRVTKTHAKFVLIRNDAWNLAIRTSMNLNMNPRFENFEISDDPALADFLGEIVEEIFQREDCGVRLGAGAGRGQGRVDIPACDSAFKALWRGRPDTQATPAAASSLPASLLNGAERKRKDRQLAMALLVGTQ